MFTGIVHGVGQITAVTSSGDPGSGDLQLEIDCPGLDGLGTAVLGDSIAVSGVCLTAIALGASGFAADVSRETLECTTLGGLAAGDRVNLETALRLSTPLGGHLVSGHVDGVGTVVERRAQARSVRFRIEFPETLARYVAAKGSVCADGVSLTVNDVTAHSFGVNIIPHTMEVTTLDAWSVGRAVNLEVDLLARYLERLLEARGG